MSPAWPSSRSLRNISTPVTVVVCALSLMPMMSTVSPCDLAALDPAGDHRATAGDREHVLDRHQERLVDLADRLGDATRRRRPCSSRTFSPHSASPSSALSAETRMTGTSSPGNSYCGQQLADLELDELEDLLVVDHVGLVQRHHDVRHADLAGQQHVLAGLRHRAVGGRDDQDRAVHLRRAGDHVLDVVGVTGAVDVRVVPRLGLVLDVRDRDRDAALALFRRLVDLVERREAG